MINEVKPPFLEDAAKGVGCEPLQKGPMEEYTWAVALETSGQKVSLEELRDKRIFSIEVLLKRIEVLNLPIEFNPTGLIAAYAMSNNNPGRIVTLLIDCLTKYEGKTVTACMLADLYPYGFYNEETFAKYVDDYLKNPEVRGKVKWGTIY